MTILHPTSLPSKVHLYIEDNGARSFVLTRRCFSFGAQGFKGDTYVAHLLLEGILPKHIFILLINFNCRFN